MSRYLFSSCRFVTTLAVLVVSLLPLAGCKQRNLTHSWSWLPGVEDPPQVPEKLMAVWSNAQLQSDNGQAVRGFGARLMFYDKNEKPVRVEGTLVVYGFDDQKPEGKSSRADRKFVFTPEQLKSHYSKSQLGHSYSVFIPWDKPGGAQQQVSLIVRFNPLGGPAIVGTQAKVMLPGEMLNATEIAVRQPPRVEGVGEVPIQANPAQRVHSVAHHTALGERQADAASATKRQQMKTTTIPLPSRGQ